MSNTRRAKGVVLHVTNYGDAHRIVDVLTPELGRLSALARSARTSKKRFGGALDLFMEGTFALTQPKAGQNLWTMDSAELGHARLGIRQDLDALTRASLLCEAVRYLFLEAQDLPEVYDAFVWALDLLDRGAMSEAAGAWVRLVSLAGIVQAPPQSASEAVQACFLGAACNDTQTAASVEELCMRAIEYETGRRFVSKLF